jgi:hypothetical protein
MTVVIDGKTYPIGRDSINPLDIPVDGTDYAMGYINGSISAWPAGGWNRFPAARHVAIDVLGDRPDADALDVEHGDVEPGSATMVNWVLNKLKRGERPVLYMNRSALTPSFNALNGHGLWVAHQFWLWIATLDGTQRVGDMTGVVAVQDKGTVQTGGHYDESIIWDPTWKEPVAPPPAPVPAPVPVPPAVRAGVVVAVSDAGSLVSHAVTSKDGGKTWVDV